jgi:hypothetical protein
MKITDKRRQILELISILISSGNSVVGTVEPAGTFNIDGGTEKKKYQSMKGAFAIPHEAIIDEEKRDISVFQNSFIMPIAAIPEELASIKVKELRDKQKVKFDKWLEDRPRIKNALIELIEAIDEEKKKGSEQG